MAVAVEIRWIRRLEKKKKENGQGLHWTSAFER